MKKKIIIPSLILLIMVISIITIRTYGIYKNNVKINVHSTSSKLICNAVVESNNYVSTEGYSMFKVKVYNYIEDSITKVPIKYKVTIENKDNTIGNYKYDSAFTKKLETDYDTFSTNAKQEKTYEIKVKADTNEEKEINYKVTVDCYQDNE